MGKCKNCNHSKSSDEVAEGLTCIHPKFIKGYNYTFTDLEPDGAWLDNDNGWTWVVGPEFGCIHFEESKPCK